MFKLTPIWQPLFTRTTW